MTKRNNFNWSGLLFWCTLVPTVAGILSANALIGEPAALRVAAVGYPLLTIAFLNFLSDWRLERRLGRALLRFTRRTAQRLLRQRSKLPMARVVKRRQ